MCDENSPPKNGKSKPVVAEAAAEVSRQGECRAWGFVILRGTTVKILNIIRMKGQNGHVRVF